MALRDTVDFLLYDWLQVSHLNQRERFADHSRETFDAVLDTCERIARDKYAPFNAPSTYKSRNSMAKKSSCPKPLTMPMQPMWAQAC